MEVDDRYKNTLDIILKDIPKSFVKKGKHSERLYDLIRDGFDFYDSTNINNMVLSVLTEKNMIIKTASSYFPKSIQHRVQEDMKKQLHYTYYLPGDRIVNVYIGLMDNNIVNYQKYHDMMRLIISWAHICTKYSYKECSKKQNIYIYPTKLEKVLPMNEVVVLGTEHVNTAVTTRCSANNETIIYRQEEWFKVYVHEMMHSYGLDINDSYNLLINNLVKKLFNVRSSMKVAEAYVETWARIINGAYAAVMFSESKEDFEELFLFTMEVERLFSVIQAQKVLAYMNLTYNNVIERGSRLSANLYRENSNVFAYYILTAMLMNDPYTFLQFCSRINRKWIRFDNTLSAVKELENYIKLAHMDPTFIKNMETNFQVKDKGLRMSLIDVN